MFANCLNMSQTRTAKVIPKMRNPGRFEFRDPDGQWTTEILVGRSALCEKAVAL